MNTTRRTFLKGSAAFATAIAAPAFIRSGRLSAQGPQYELIDLVTFSEGVQFGSQTLKGIVSAINASGQVAGGQAHEGLLRAAVWTLDGEVTFLESGEFGAYASVINSGGDIGGRLLNDGQDPINVRSAAWLNGELIEAPIPDGFVSLDESGSVIGLVTAINDDGVMTGSLGSNAFRWFEGTFELLPLDPGAGVSGRSGGSALSPAGAIGGSLRDSAEAFIWKQDGSVQTFGLPLFPGDRQPKAPGIGVLRLSDDDEMLIQVSDYDADQKETYRWIVRYRSGVPELQPVFNGIEGFPIWDADDTGAMIGNQVIDGANAGVLWTDGQLYDLNDLVVPSGLTITLPRDISPTGEILAMATDASALTHGVVLRPV
jgi:hypothetical protein